MSFVQYTQNKSGKWETASYGLYIPKADCWAMCNIDGLEFLMLFQTAELAGRYKEQLVRGNPASSAADVRKIASGDARDEVLSSTVANGLLFVSSSGATQRFVLREPKQVLH